MKIYKTMVFDILLGLAPAQAFAFVQNVEASLAKATFLHNVHMMQVQDALALAHTDEHDAANKNAAEENKLTVAMLEQALQKATTNPDVGTVLHRENASIETNVDMRTNVGTGAKADSAALLQLPYIFASIVVNAALFGERALSFQSFLVPQASGAMLVALPLASKIAWAEVSGVAKVYDAQKQPVMASLTSVLHPTERTESIEHATEYAGECVEEYVGEAARQQTPSSRSYARYELDIGIHLHLPKAEKWGGKALTKMIHFTAEQTLERITKDFPQAIQHAAEDFAAENLSPAGVTPVGG